MNNSLYIVPCTLCKALDRNQNFFQQAIYINMEFSVASINKKNNKKL